MIYTLVTRTSVNGWTESASFAQTAPAVFSKLDPHPIVRCRALSPGAGFPLSSLPVFSHPVRPLRLYLSSLQLSDDEG